MPIRFYTEPGKIHKIVADTALSSQEKSALLNIFAQISSKDEEELFGLLVSDPSWLQKFVNNYQTKQAAMNGRDINAWEQIIQDEEKQLAQLGAD